uniref:Uncharacterized protein n=1 Tax=Arundo donax TaxID=35708 RepID=A0A0A9D3L0_ARUDO
MIFRMVNQDVPLVLSGEMLANQLLVPRMILCGLVCTPLLIASLNIYCMVPSV